MLEPSRKKSIYTIHLQANSHIWLDENSVIMVGGGGGIQVNLSFRDWLQSTSMVLNKELFMFDIGPLSLMVLPGLLLKEGEVAGRLNDNSFAPSLQAIALDVVERTNLVYPFIILIKFNSQ